MVLEQLFGKGKIVKCMYETLLERETIKYDHGRFAWQNELKCYWATEEWKAFRLKAFQIVKLTKLQWFQYQLLSKRIVTNVVRHRWDRSISELCEFCGESKETELHVFWECKVIQQFWIKLQDWVRYICKMNCTLNAVQVVTNSCDDALIETIVLIAKQYIYATKCMKNTPKVNILLQKVHSIYITEKAVSSQTLTRKKFEKKWGVYIKHVV